MPAAASENTLGRLFGGRPANRRCSEWREAGRSSVGGQERHKGKPGFGPAEQKVRNGRLKDGLGTARWKEKVRSACRGGPNQPPDGTGRRRMSRARNAGPQGPPEETVAGESRTRCDEHHDADTHGACTGSALSRITAVALPNTPGKAIAQTQPEQAPTSVGLVATPAPFALGARSSPFREAKYCRLPVCACGENREDQGLLHRLRSKIDQLRLTE
jgi:hypothetical protein